MDDQEWLARLDEAEQLAKQPGNQAPVGDLFRPANDGAPLSQQQKDALQQHWNATRSLVLAKIQAI